MSAPRHLIYLDADQQRRDVMARAFASTPFNGILHCLSSASNAILYLNRLGPFRECKRPDLIILDINLPRFEGGDFLQMLQTNLQFRSIPRCIMTKAIAADQLDPGQQLSLERYYVKSVTEQDALVFAQIVQHWFEISPSITR